MDTQNWPQKTACEIFNNSYRVYLWQILERSARILGKSKDADDCAAKIDKARKLIHATFYDARKQLYGLDEQAYQVMPLMTGIVPEALVGTVQKKLEEIILVKNKGHLDTGMLGTYFLIQYLQQAGRNDLLYTIFNQETYPGWGYMLAQGATTMWEQWNGYYSQIHSCFASPGSWFYQGLAGIRPDEAGPGFKKIIIKPGVVGDLTWVKCSYDSIHGRIVSNWNREGDKLTMDVTIPINTTATVYVPAKNASGVTESGKPAAKVEGVKFLKMENNAAIYAVGSGTYRFQSTLS
jgi:alpha-L-rhamnosidase